jgi:hypothetical protein
MTKKVYVLVPITQYNKKFKQQKSRKLPKNPKKVIKKEENKKKSLKKFYKKKTITTALKQKVWDLHFKRTVAFCKCCDINVITLNTCHMSHILAEKNGGKTDIYNLVPCCPSCNLSMTTQHLEEFKKENGFNDKKITNKLRENMLNHLMELHKIIKNQK